MLRIPLEQLYTAYRKAKKEAFNDTNCAHGLKFARYEQNLDRNLRDLQRLLRRDAPDWPEDRDFIGSASCIPKTVDQPSRKNAGPEIHCQSSDPLEQWRRQCDGGHRAKADFRPVINTSVDFLIVSALWILEVGHLYDERLDVRYAVGNRLRRWRANSDAPAGRPGALNTLSPDLFQPYFTAYGKWRTAGLKAMRRDLAAGHRIVAVTMDLKRFYHHVDASFLLREAYLDEINLDLTLDQAAFTKQLIRSFVTFNRALKELLGGEHHGLPVGLPASGLIANVLLAQFDRHVVSQLAPSYYARYVDDVFLVVRHVNPFSDGAEFLRWLGERLSPLASAITAGTEVEQGDGSALQLNLPYADGSDLRFVGKKQKIFQLEGPHGIDLIGPIEEQIRQQTSEHRDLPSLPDTESAMAHRALMVSSDATLNADALRKADAVTLRRSGFAMLLGDVEAHVRDLAPSSWSALRHQFYELAHRHLLTPNAFFDYFRYLPRIVGIMATCRDWDHASRFTRGFRKLLRCLHETCEISGGSREALRISLRETCLNLADRTIEAVLQAGTKDRRLARDLIHLIREVVSSDAKGPSTIASIRKACDQFSLLDWARTPYAQVWLEQQSDAEPPEPPTSGAVRARLPFAAIRRFRRAARLPIPHWPALAFPTRPIPLREITSRAPSLIEDGEALSSVVQGLRGSWMPLQTGLVVSSLVDGGPNHLVIPYESPPKPRVAITSIEVSDAEWLAAAGGTPSLTLDRYRRLNGILDAVVAQKRSRPGYVILPECCLPRRWAMNMAGRVLSRGVSIIAGLEYRQDTADANALHNEALVALRSRFPGYNTSLFLYQPKREAAWHERQELANKFGKYLAKPSRKSLHYPVYQHDEFSFGVLICSEMTDLATRIRFQGQVDALFIPEWNQDIESFGALVEAAALDVHAYIAQANNRRYGDSRMRAPLKAHYLRDVIRLKGGLNDYFVIGEIDFMALRRFQSHAVPPTGEQAEFKPFPIGFSDRLSHARRTTPG